MNKRFLSLLIGLLLTFCTMAFVLSGCDKQKQQEIKIALDGEIVSTVEFGGTFTVPSARLVDQDNNAVDGDIEIIISNPNDIVVSTAAGEINADKIGNYKVSYSSLGVDSLEYVVKSQDTVGPTITAKDVFYNLYKGEEVYLPTEIVEDVSEVDYNSAVLKVYKKDNPSKQYTISNMKTFVPDEVGEYVYTLEICDAFGNKSTKEWEFFIADKTWTASDATGRMIASFDNADYVNVFGGGTATDRQGNPDVEILDQFKGETGVAKVSMNYFNHNFGYYSSLNLRFPRTYTYQEGKRIAIRMYIEDSSIDLERFNVMVFEHTHIEAVGVNIVGYLPVEEGAWFTAVLPSSVLNGLKDENGIIKGVQLDVKQAADCLGTEAQVVYIASITEIEQLAVPTGVAQNQNKITWNAVENAAAYEVYVNGEKQIVTDTEIALPQGGYKVKVKALGDGVMFEDSSYSAEITNMLGAPTNLSINSEKVISWDAVGGAQGYVIDINGQSTQLGNVTTFVFDKPENQNYIVKVKAVGDGNQYFDSEYVGMVIRYVAQKDGIVADFSDETYIYCLESASIAYNLVDAGAVASDFSAEYLESYEGAEGVLKIKITTNVNGWGVVALELPETLSLVNANSLSIKFRVEGVSKGPYKGLRLYGFGNDNAARSLNANTYDEMLNDWYTVTINRKGIYEGLNYAFNNATSSDYILLGVALMPAETDYFIYLDSITVEEVDRLATPTNLVMENGVLTWDTVANAEKYVVTVNGEEQVVTTNSFELPAINYVITVRAEATGYIESYESTSVTKRQEVIDDLAAALGEKEYAKFNNENYVYFFENTAQNDKVASAEIVQDPKGEKGNVLHISGNGGYNKVYIYLPKALPKTFSIEYRMIANATAANYLWDFMTGAEGWSGVWCSAQVDAWTTYNVSAGFGYEGKDKLVIGFNNVGDFDLYISIIEYQPTAEEIKADLVSKLGENELGRFDEKAYTTYVTSFFYNADVTAEYKVKTDLVNDSVKGNVIRISNGEVPAGNYGRIKISLPKAITSRFTLNYKVVSTATAGATSLMSLQHGVYPGWDYAWPLSQNSDWTTVTIDSYAGKDYFEIILQGYDSFEIYVSVVEYQPSAEEIKADLISKLGENQFGRFDEKAYASYVTSYFYNADVTAEYKVKTDLVNDGVKGNVIRISNGEVPAGNYGRIKISLPKAIVSKFTLNYKVVSTATAGATSLMSLQHGVYAGWDYAWPLSQNSDWTTVTIDSYAGKDYFEIILQGYDSFEIYVSVVEYQPTAEEIKADLVSKLGENELGRFDEKAYASYVTSYFYNADVTAEYKVKTDLVNDSEKGNVIRISNGEVPAGNYGRIKISLPKAITSSFTLNYKVASSATLGATPMMSLQHGVYAGWDYAWPLSQNSDWTTVTIDSYAGKDYFEIILQGFDSFEIYVSVVEHQLSAEEIKAQLTAKLDLGELAKFDDKNYATYVTSFFYNADVTVAYPVAVNLVKDNVKGNVIRISNGDVPAGNYGRIRVSLLKTIPSSFKLNYRVVSTATAGATSLMSLQHGLYPGWDYAWPLSQNTAWTTVTIDSYANKDYFEIILQGYDNFEIYISTVESILSAEEIKTGLSAKLEGNELGKFNESAYTSSVEAFFYNAEVTVAYKLAVDIVEDATMGKVMRISNGEVPAGNYGRMKISLPKAITSKFTLNYRVVSTATTGATSLMSLQHGLYPGWDYAWPLSQNSDWTTVTIDSYAGKDYFEIILQGYDTFEIYVSLVSEAE